MYNFGDCKVHAGFFKRRQVTQSDFTRISASSKDNKNINFNFLATVPDAFSQASMHAHMNIDHTHAETIAIFHILSLKNLEGWGMVISFTPLRKVERSHSVGGVNI